MGIFIRGVYFSLFIRELEKGFFGEIGIGLFLLEELEKGEDY